MRDDSDETLYETVRNSGDPEAARELAGRLLKAAGAEDTQTSRSQLIGAAWNMATEAAEDPAAALEAVGLTDVSISNRDALRAIGDAVKNAVDGMDMDAYEAYFREETSSTAERSPFPMGEGSSSITPDNETVTPTKEEEAARYEADMARVKKKAKQSEQQTAEKAAKVQEALETIFSATGDDKASLELEDELLQRLMEIRNRATQDGDGRRKFTGGSWKKGLNVAAEALGKSLGVNLSPATIAKKLGVVYEAMDEAMARGYTAHEALAAGLRAARELTQDLYAQSEGQQALYLGLQSLKEYCRENVGELYLDEEDWREIRERIGIRKFRQALEGIIPVRMAKNSSQSGHDIANYWQEGLGQRVGAEDLVNTVDMLSHRMRRGLTFARSPRCA